MSKSELAKRAHLDRATLDRIESGQDGVRDTSLAAAERVLRDLDEEMSPPPGQEERPSVVRFVVRGVYGAESLVVEGPVENIAELELSVDRIMRRLRQSPDEP
jgi:transcriptional regulator with XRE-family HTH domain